MASVVSNFREKRGGEEEKLKKRETVKTATRVSFSLSSLLFSLIFLFCPHPENHDRLRHKDIVFPLHLSSPWLGEGGVHVQTFCVWAAPGACLRSGPPAHQCLLEQSTRSAPRGLLHAMPHKAACFVGATADGAPPRVERTAGRGQPTTGCCADRPLPRPLRGALTSASGYYPLGAKLPVLAANPGRPATGRR